MGDYVPLEGWLLVASFNRCERSIWDHQADLLQSGTNALDHIWEKTNNCINNQI